MVATKGIFIIVYRYGKNTKWENQIKNVGKTGGLTNDLRPATSMYEVKKGLTTYGRGLVIPIYTRLVEITCDDFNLIF